MKVEIKEERKNPFMKRDELAAAIEHTGEATPSKAALQQLLAKQLNKGIEHIDIRDIFSLGGVARSSAKVFVWEEKTAKDLSKAESKEAKEEVKEGEKEAVIEMAKKEAPKEEKRIQEAAAKEEEKGKGAAEVEEQKAE